MRVVSHTPIPIHSCQQNFIKSCTVSVLPRTTHSSRCAASYHTHSSQCCLVPHTAVGVLPRTTHTAVSAASYHTQQSVCCLVPHTQQSVLPRTTHSSQCAASYHTQQSVCCLVPHTAVGVLPRTTHSSSVHVLIMRRQQRYAHADFKLIGYLKQKIGHFCTTNLTLTKPGNYGNKPFWR